jgi:hypothetical protein
MKLLLSLLFLIPSIYGQEVPTLKKPETQDHLSRSRTKRFDHFRVRPPVKITVVKIDEITVVYESDGIIYNETFTIDKDSVVHLGQNYLCPDIRKKCKEFWVMVQINSDPLYLAVITGYDPKK